MTSGPQEPLREPLREPLGQVTSIKVKLGLLVAASVLVAAVLATAGAGTVPAWLSIPVTVLLAIGVTQLLAVGMTSPLRQMTEAARRMAAGHYDVRVQTGSTDEVGELARAFNTMSADLAAVDRQRRDLVASVSHELRTPLTALVAVLENLDDGVIAPDPETVHVARAQAERLGDLVDDLLDLSRLDAGVVPLDRSSQPVAPLVEAVVAEAASGPGASQRGVTFEVRVEPPDLAAYADRARLHQLLANLLDNAARHSPAGGVVHVWAGVVDGRTRFEVADEGPGIAPQDRERVFERFGTLPDSGGGTGLGLAIARWVTDLHGGRITVVDPVPTETGARFRVELPDSSTDRTSPMDAPPSPLAPMVPPLSAPAPPRPATSDSMVDSSFGNLWVDRGVPPRRWVLLACIAIGLFAGWTVPDSNLGLAATLDAGRLRRAGAHPHPPPAQPVHLGVRGAGLRVRPDPRPARRGLARGARTDGLCGTRHGRPHRRHDRARDDRRGDGVALRRAARVAVARPDASRLQPRHEHRGGHPDDRPVRARRARLRAAVRQRRRDLRALGRRGAARRAGHGRAPALPHGRRWRHGARSGVPRDQPARRRAARRTTSCAAPLRVARPGAARRRVSSCCSSRRRPRPSSAVTTTSSAPPG